MALGSKPSRVAVMLDLHWSYKRHADIFAGTQQYAEARNWHTIIYEFAHNTLPARRTRSVPYDGVIARANIPLAERVLRLGVPVVNVCASSPARSILPGVYPDFTIAGQLCAEHLLSGGFRRFATLASPRNFAHEQEVAEFIRLVGEVDFFCTRRHVPQTSWCDLADWRKTDNAIQRWKADWEPPIGVYVAEEEIARLVTQACHRPGWRVPANVAIIAGQKRGNPLRAPTTIAHKH